MVRRGGYEPGEATYHSPDFSPVLSSLSGIGQVLDTTNLSDEAKLGLNIALGLGLGNYAALDVVAGTVGTVAKYFAESTGRQSGWDMLGNMSRLSETDKERKARERREWDEYKRLKKEKIKRSTGIGSSSADIAAYVDLMNNRFVKEAQYKKLLEDFRAKHSTDANYLNSNISRPSSKTVLTPQQLIDQQTAQQALVNNTSAPAVNQTLVNQIVRNRIINIHKDQQVAAEQLKANQAAILSNQAVRTQLSDIQTGNIGVLTSNRSSQLAQVQENQQKMSQSQQSVLNATIAQQQARTATPVPVTVRRIPPPVKGVIGSGSKLLNRVMSEFNMSKSEAKRYIKKYGDS